MRNKLIWLILLFAAMVNCASALNLRESIDIALRNNPAVIAEKSKVEAGEARLGQASGAFFPTVRIAGDYGRSYAQPSNVQITTQTSLGAASQNYLFGTDVPGDARSWTASLSQPILVASLFPALAIAQKGAEIDKEGLKKVILDTSFNVTQAYFNVIKAQKMVKYYEESKEMAESHLNQVKEMVTVGISSRAEWLRAEVQVANSEVALTHSINALELACATFNNELGNDLEQEIKLDEAGFTGTVSAIPEYKDLLSLAFENRPDWRQYLLNKGISEEDLNSARTAYLPSVLLTASTGNRITEYPNYKSDVNSWSVVGLASWTLFDGLGIQNRVREAAANLNAQKATEELIRKSIALEVRDAYLSLKNALGTIGSAKKAVESAEEGYKVFNQRYNSGIGTNLEVLDAQVSLTQAKINQLQALFDLEIAKARINKVIGKEINIQ